VMKHHKQAHSRGGQSLRVRPFRAFR
jgi:hypothetical protein